MLKENFQYSTLILSVVMITLFGLQHFIPEFTDSYKLEKDILQRPWILVTNIFLHANIVHLLLNLFSLVLFGVILENFIGTKKFLLLFFGSGIISSFIASFFYTSALGASGAIFGILGALAVIKPKMMIWAYGMPMPMIIGAIVYLVINIFGAYYQLGNTGYIAHLSGLAIGAVFGFRLRTFNKKIKENFSVIDKELDNYEKNFKLR